MFGIPTLTSARKAVGFLLLPMIFALVGLLALTVTQLPTQAAQSEVWSATMTTEESPNTEDIGFEADSGSGQTFGSLTDKTFVFEGTTYTILRLARDQVENFLEFQVDPDLPPSLVDSSTLTLGESSFVVASAIARPSSIYRWTGAGLTFAVDTDVSASLVRLVAPPAQPSNFAATVGDDSVTLTWDDPRDGSITGYKYRRSEDGGETWSVDWTAISGSGANTFSHTIAGLTAGAEYTFAILAVNSDGDGAPSLEAQITPGEDLDVDDDGLIQVSNLAQLNAIRWDLDGDGSSTVAGYATAFSTARTGMGCPESGCIGYELTTYLDFDTNGDGAVDSSDDYWNDGAGWEPIADGSTPPEGVPEDAPTFNTTFDGGGHTVSNLFINRATDNIGLFGVTGSGSVVRNVGLPFAKVTGKQGVGALVGRVASGKITGSFSTGSVTGTSNDVGGLVGRTNSGSIAVSYSTAAVRGDTSVGGLVGYTEEGSITASYATGSASGNANVGGLVGKGGSGSVQASYAIGPVKGTFSDGLVGYGGATISHSYWNTETTDTTGGGGRDYGKTTDELKSPTAYGDGDDIYANWNVDVDGDGNLDDPWDFGTNQQYPALKIDFNGDNDATWQEFGFQRAVAGFTATAGSGQVTISWDDLGDPAVSHFEVRQSDDDGDTWATWETISGSNATTTNHTVTGLTSGVAYTFQIRPVKDYGSGLASESATATPVAPVALNAAPSFVDGPTANRSVAENMPPGTSIGARISATDSDASDSLIYSISRNDDGAFVVDIGGQLSNTKTLNYEQKSSYSITLRVEDNDGASDTIDVSVAVTDVNDPPIFVDGESTTRRIAENSPPGTKIGQPITATDEDDVPRYAVHASSGNDLSVFQFDFDTGQFSVDLTRLDHEAKSSYSLTVEANDDDDATTFIDVTIEIIDVAEPPPAPGAPTISPAGEAGDTTLNVSWTAPDTTGRPDIIGYDVRFRSGSNQNWTIRSLAGNTTSGNISGLVPGAIYVMQVAAKNDEGVSPWSSPGTGSTNLAASEQQPPTTPEPTAPPTVAPTVPPTPPAPPPTAQEILTLFAENPEQAGEVVGKLADGDPEEAGRVISKSAEEDEQAAGQIICSAVGGHGVSIGRAVGHAAKENAGSTSNALGTISDDGDCVSQLGSVIPVEPWLPEQPPQRARTKPDRVPGRTSVRRLLSKTSWPAFSPPSKTPTPILPIWTNPRLELNRCRRTISRMPTWTLPTTTLLTTISSPPTPPYLWRKSG